MRWAVVVGILLHAAVARAAAHGADPPLDDAVAQAATEGKTLVVEIGTAWCGPCKRFAAKILPGAAVEDASGEVVFVRYDAEKGNGTEAAARLAVDSYPTFLVLDGKGRVRRRLAGVPWRNGDAFAAWLLDVAATGLDDEAIKARRARDGHGPRVELIAAGFYARERRFADADDAYAAAAKGPGRTGTTARAARQALKTRWAAWKVWAAARRWSTGSRPRRPGSRGGRGSSRSRAPSRGTRAPRGCAR